MSTAAEHYQLYLELIDSEPSIWRRFWVPSQITLAQLHPVLQATMGWHNRADHWYQQKLEALDEATQLKSLITAGPIVYRYDSKDGWLHRLTLEQVLPLDSQRPALGCMAGAMACPPEGSGGVWGYDEFLDDLEAASSPEGEWEAASDFDPDYFDLEEANARLAQLNFCLHSE